MKYRIFCFCFAFSYDIVSFKMTRDPLKLDGLQKNYDCSFK
jgi:hypothetical protein